MHHPKHGFITVMPHLDEMGWSFKEELVKSIRQKVNPGNGTAETTWYQYDANGQRIRKITENSAGAEAIPTKKEERIYISGYETYRTYQANLINFERESLSLIDQGNRFVMVETVKQNTKPAPAPSETVGARLVRYQLHNHLGSSCLELDAFAQVISYEEYHPFGTTAFQAQSATIKAAAKRYRFTGMERDEETGLEYHSARYYLPWLARWASTDPTGIKDGTNVYAYVVNNPVIKTDLTGKQATTGGNTTPVPTPQTEDPPDEAQPTPPPQATAGGPGQPAGRTGLSVTFQRQRLSAAGAQGGGTQLGYAFNRGIAQSKSLGGIEITGNLTLAGDTTGTVTGASPSAGVHVWYGPDGSRFILGGYLALNYTLGQSPPDASTNFGGAFTVAPELHLGGPDADHSPVVIGGNVNFGFQQSTQVAQTGDGAPSTYVPNPVNLTGSLNLTYNPVYYSNSKVPIVSIYAEGAGGGILNGDTTGRTQFGSVGGGASVNILDGTQIYTFGAATGYRWQGDTVGSGMVPAGGPFVYGTFGISWY